MTPLEEIHDALRRAGDAGDGVLTTVTLGALRALVLQEPVAVFKGAHDGRFVIDFLHGYIPPVHTALYTGPVAKQPVKEYCPNCYCKCCQQETWSKAE